MALSLLTVLHLPPACLDVALLAEPVNCGRRRPQRADFNLASQLGEMHVCSRFHADAPPLRALSLLPVLNLHPRVS